MKRTCLVAFYASFAIAFTSHAQDLEGLQLHRNEYYTQCTRNGPAPESARGHNLAAWAIGSYHGSVIVGAVDFRDQTWALTNVESVLYFNDDLPMPAPGGSYAFTVRTASEGIKTYNVSLPPMSKKLAPPRIENFEAAQSIDPQRPFAIQWAPLAGSRPEDKLELRIFSDKGELVEDLDLNIAQLQYTMPAGRLQPNSTNRAYLRFGHLISARPPQNGKPYVVTVETRTTLFSLVTKNPAGEITFSSNKLLTNESAGAILIPLQRSGNVGYVQVNYFLEPLTAMPGVNYQPVAGTVSFPPGVTTGFVTIPLLDDGVPSAPLVGRLWLTNATGGATLPSRPWVNWTILDSQSAPASSIDAVLLVKATAVRQVNPGLPAASLLCAPHRFYASVQPAFPGAVTDATLRSGSRITQLSEPHKSLLEYNEDFPARAAMDKAFRAGTYTVSTRTHDGTVVPFTVRIRREPLFPVPHLSNWAAAQQIDPAAPFTLEWDPFTGATSNDAVRLAIADPDNRVIYETPEILEPGLLPGSTTSHVLPANLLQPGRTYRLSIGFSKLPGIESISGTRTANAFIHATVTEIKTLGTAASSAKNCCGETAPEDFADSPWRYDERYVWD